MIKDKQINNLTLADTYSLVLFTLFQAKKIPEYGTLSELIYLMDEKTLLKFLQYFGGMTIKVPTMQEFEEMVRALTLYNKVQLEHLDFEETYKGMGMSFEMRTNVLNLYKQLCKIMEDFSFVPRELE